MVLLALVLKVRDVQRMTGAMIKLPEDQATQGEETFVEIFASFMAAMVCTSCMFFAICVGTTRTFELNPCLLFTEQKSNVQLYVISVLKNFKR